VRNFAQVRNFAWHRKSRLFLCSTRERTKLITARRRNSDFGCCV